MLSEQTEPSALECFPAMFTQRDNVDHNVACLNGRRSFHWTGLIAITSQCGENEARLQDVAVKRLTTVSTKKSIRSLGLSIREYVSPEKHGRAMLVVHKLRAIRDHEPLQHASRLDLIWSYGWISREPASHLPGRFYAGCSRGLHHAGMVEYQRSWCC